MADKRRSANDSDEADIVKKKHHSLAGVVKGVHATLRKRYKQSGNSETVWKEHCQDSKLLSQYAEAMHDLATEIWTKHPETRIEWCYKTCMDYFFHGGLQKVLDKEQRRRQYVREKSITKDPSSGGKVRSRSAERCCNRAEHETQEHVCPKILSASANQIQNYSHGLQVPSCRPTSNLCLSLENKVIQSSSQGTSQGASSLELESASQQGDLRCSISVTSEPVVRPDPSSSPNKDGGLVSSQESCDTDMQSPSSESDLIFGEMEGLESGKPTKPAESAEYNKQKYNVIKVPFEGKIRLLDVGSCFNPFQKFPEIQALGIDISPAVETVYHCDFLSLEMTEPLQLAADSLGAFLPNLRSPIKTLPKESFHVIVFSLLLEYFPAPYQRWICCQKAQQLLAVNGILIIITPDSHHQNKNAPMMKSWKRAIESMGFCRWRYVKLEHLHCIVFRKVMTNQDQEGKNMTLTLGDISPDMLYIPQDFQTNQDDGDHGAYLFGSVPQSEDDSFFIKQNFDELPDLVDSF